MREQVKVVVSGAGRLAPRYLELLKNEGYQLELVQEAFPSEAQVKAVIADAHVYVHAGEEILTESILEHATQLRMIACLASGAEHLVDIDAADRLGIAVTNTPGLKVMYEAMGEFLVGMVIALRRKVLWFHTEQKQGRLHETDTPLLKDAVIGVVGMGKVGSRVARMMHAAFGSSIVYTANSDKPEIERELGAVRLPMDELLKASDVVILACPYDRTTFGFIGARELGLMKPTALLINTSEGALVDGRAVYQALRDNQIAGAAFDDKNWDADPLIKDGEVINMPIEMLELPDDRFICTPYVGAMTSAVWDEMADVAFGSVLQYMSRGTDRNLYNRSIDAVRRQARETAQQGGALALQD